MRCVIYSNYIRSFYLAVSLIQIKGHYLLGVFWGIYETVGFVGVDCRWISSGNYNVIYPDFNSCLLLICMKIFHICRFIFHWKHRTRISSAFLRLFWASCYIPYVFKFQSLSLSLSPRNKKKNTRTNAKLSTNWSRQNMNQSSWLCFAMS